jgi:uncharacterized membrane protein YedE/YeeE
MSGGCTNGHIFLGLPKPYLRSYIATPIFIVVAMAISNLRAYYPSLTGQTTFSTNYNSSWQWVSGFFLAIVAVNLLVILIRSLLERKLNQILLTYAIGAIYGTGIIFSGIVRPTKVIGFLTLGK